MIDIDSIVAGEDGESELVIAGERTPRDGLVLAIAP
jgi:hypothetical protein